MDIAARDSRLLRSTMGRSRGPLTECDSPASPLAMAMMPFTYSRPTQPLQSASLPSSHWIRDGHRDSSPPFSPEGHAYVLPGLMATATGAQPNQSLTLTEQRGVGFRRARAENWLVLEADVAQSLGSDFGSTENENVRSAGYSSRREGFTDHNQPEVLSTS